MKTLITLSTALVLLVTVGCHPASRGGVDGGLRESGHMNRVSPALARVESGSNGVGVPILDGGHSSWFN